MLAAWCTWKDQQWTKIALSSQHARGRKIEQMEVNCIIPLNKSQEAWNIPPYSFSIPFSFYRFWPQGEGGTTTKYQLTNLKLQDMRKIILINAQSVDMVFFC